jgi:hypothetical protein
MKKSKEKSSDKSSKKDIKKVARKELQSSLSARFKEVIESLGHEAEMIAEDIEKAGKLFSKKLTGKKNKVSDKNSSKLLKKLDSAIEEVKAKQDHTANAPAQAAGKDVKTVANKPKSRASTKAANEAVGAAAKATTISTLTRNKTARSVSNPQKESSSTSNSSADAKKQPQSRTVKATDAVGSATEKKSVDSANQSPVDTDTDAEIKTE